MLILVLILWSGSLTALYLTSQGQAGDSSRQVEDVESDLASVERGQADSERALQALASSAQEFNTEQQSLRNDLRDTQRQAETSQDDVEALADLLAAAGVRIDTTQGEVQQLTRGVFGLGSATFEYDALGRLESCANANFAAIDRLLSGIGLNLLYLQTC